jgi:transposase
MLGKNTAEHQRKRRSQMELYCGIDLHARNLFLIILNGLLKVIFQRRFSNDLELIIAALEPYREAIAGIAVESTFNWYWLVDGLMDHGYRLHLANTNKFWPGSRGIGLAPL